MNGRWAMLGAAGCIAPEILGNAGIIPDSTNILWWKTGVFPPAGSNTYYNGMDPYALFWIEVLLMQIAELRRLQDYKNPGSMGPGRADKLMGIENLTGGSGEPAYPGAPACLLPAVLTAHSWKRVVGGRSAVADERVRRGSVLQRARHGQGRGQQEKAAHQRAPQRAPSDDCDARLRVAGGAHRQGPCAEPDGPLQRAVRAQPLHQPRALGLQRPVFGASVPPQLIVCA